MSAEFLPNLRTNVMEELLVTEGLLFRDETAKLFYMELKNMIIKKFEHLHSLEDFSKKLEEFDAWSDELEKQELAEVPKFCFDNLLKVTVLYAKYLFSKEGCKDSIKIKKPYMETLLYGINKRLASSTNMKSGAFFEMDPLRQDFAFREAFRLSLSECINVVDEVEVAKEEIKEEKNQVKEEKDELEPETDMRAVPVLPEDSISNFGGRSVVSEFKKAKSVVSTSSKATKASVKSGFSKPPEFKRVKLQEIQEDLNG
jgi:hypothetical protein